MWIASKGHLENGAESLERAMSLREGGGEGVLFGADTTSNAERFRDEGDLGSRVNLDTHLSCKRPKQHRDQSRIITPQHPRPRRRLLATWDSDDSPIRTTGHDFLHSCLHFLGLHRSGFTRAILESENTLSDGNAREGRRKGAHRVRFDMVQGQEELQRARKERGLY